MVAPPRTTMGSSARFVASLWACTTFACFAEPAAPNPNYTRTPSGPLPAGDLTVCDVAAAVLIPKCSACHRAGGQAPDLSLDGARGLVNMVGAGGAALVVPGSREQSLLYRKVAGTHTSNEGMAMPPGSPLTPALIDGVGRWIDQGAVVACTPTGPLPTPERHHPEGWREPGYHGLELKLRTSEADCRNCHGADLTGDLGPSCDSCHQEGWRKNCTFCHGGTDDTSGAPPRDLSGELTNLSFRAHTAHRAATQHPSYDCSSCHTKPTEVTSPGHVFDDTPGRAEVNFSGGFSAGATYLGQGRCSNLYCHGADIGGSGTGDHLDPPTCGSCHVVPTSDPSTYDNLSGAHKKHLDEGLTCDRCHANTVERSVIIGPEAHANGAVDIRFAADVPVTYGDRGCNGTCHGELHSGARWPD